MTREFPLTSSVCHCVNLRRASRALTNYYDLALAPYGLTVNQYSIMQNIRRIEPCSVSELSRLLRLDRTTLVRNLKPLLEKGLLLDITEKGCRKRKICCSQTGIDCLNQAIHAWRQTQRNLEEYIGCDTLSKLTEALLKIEQLDAEKRRN